MRVEPHTSWARPLAGLTALLLLLGVVGVLAVDVDGDGGSRVAAAAAATAQQKTARVALTASFRMGTADTQMSGEGVVDLARERARMAMTSPSLSAPLNLVVDGRTTYVESWLPQFQAVSQGKAWVSFDAGSAAPGVGGDPLGGGGNPLQSLRLLREKGIAHSVREQGPEDVRGVRTTRLVGKLHVAKLLEEADSQQGDALARIARQAEGELEVWLGDDGLVRRSELRLVFLTGQMSLTSTVRIELFDFGVAAPIEPPAADQVRVLG